MGKEEGPFLGVSSAAWRSSVFFLLSAFSFRGVPAAEREQRGAQKAGDWGGRTED